LNCSTNSYKRFGIGYAPKYVDWSFENLSQLIRIPRAVGLTPRIEIRSADATCNPYITFKLILAAGIEGIKNGDCSLLDSTMKSGSATGSFDELPSTLEEAVNIARSSEFVTRTLSSEIRTTIFSQLDKQIQEYNLAKSKDEFEDKAYFKFI
ncbi:MAG: glutamine synthetase, partial [Ruminococcus sp.]|nr:glutamine synthetase [Ruminococcus sp.]